jgi:hypothetical protein
MASGSGWLPGPLPDADKCEEFPRAAFTRLPYDPKRF